MEKLTGTDVNELRWFFAEPPPATAEGHVAAQSYDPKGSGAYDPSQDMTLERLVTRALAHRETEWDRINGILKRVRDGLHGARHVEALRRAYDERHAVKSLEGVFEFPSVALMTATALANGVAMARHEERVARLELAITAARVTGCSPMTCTIRAIEADARGGEPGAGLIHASIFRALATAVRETDDATLAKVRAEEGEILASAGGAYRAARRELGASKKERKAAQQKAKDAEWEAYITGKKAKEAARFATKLRRAS